MQTQGAIKLTDDGSIFRVRASEKHKRTVLRSFALVQATDILVLCQLPYQQFAAVETSFIFLFFSQRHSNRISLISLISQPFTIPERHCELGQWLPLHATSDPVENSVKLQTSTKFTSDRMNDRSHNLPMSSAIFGVAERRCGTDRYFWKTLVAPRSFAALARFSCSPQILLAMAKVALLIGHLCFWCLDSLDKVTDDRQLMR